MGIEPTTGGRSTDPADLPTERTVYALRDIDYLRRTAAQHGPAVGEFAAALLDSPLPWTRMRQVYRLLSLVKKYGADRVDEACQRALEAEAVSVTLVGRMLERAEPLARRVQNPFKKDPRTRLTSRSASVGQLHTACIVLPYACRLDRVSPAGCYRSKLGHGIAHDGAEVPVVGAAGPAFDGDTEHGHARFGGQGCLHLRHTPLSQDGSHRSCVVGELGQFAFS